MDCQGSFSNYFEGTATEVAERGQARCLICLQTVGVNAESEFPELVPHPARTPNGTCSWCGEQVTDQDEKPPYPIGGQRVDDGQVGYVPMHSECGLRSVIGSAAHLRRRCHCYVTGSTESDNPDLTRRQAAREAVLLYFRQRKDEEPAWP